MKCLTPDCEHEATLMPTVRNKPQPQIGLCKGCHWNYVTNAELGLLASKLRILADREITSWKEIVHEAPSQAPTVQELSAPTLPKREM